MSRRISRSKKRTQNITVGFICLIVTVIASFAINAFQANQQDRIAALSRQTSLLEIRAKEAQRQLEFAKTNDYVERMARNMGYIKPGEVLYVTNAPAANSSN